MARSALWLGAHLSVASASGSHRSPVAGLSLVPVLERSSPRGERPRGRVLDAGSQAGF